jgi:YadA-like membrane anchor domain/Coiled stalk of trimeric autotransporter adhesin/Head domain of trimeric autotransporter adhesin
MKLELTCNHRIARAKFAFLVFSVAAAPDLIGSTAFADQVIPDDLIVQGSACIGLDCVNNESFGFDTLRLKENNTRIKFDDTSTAAGFPANDWTLVANDSASGGRNFFGIEDTTAGRMIFGVSAGAPTASLWVNSLGNVGLGTENPLLKLHLSNADTPGVRLEQTNAGGFTAQTWDIAGNEANFFIRDVTNGNKLPFRIRPGAPTSSIDIASNGFVGFGTASPTAQLHTTGTIRFEGLSGCGAGLATDAQGYLSCMVGGGSSLVRQTGAGQPITVGVATDGTQVAVNGTAGNRTITGVLAGSIATGSTEAINGDQLYTANQRVAAAFGGGAGLDGSGQVTAPSYTVQGTAYNNVGGAVNALDTTLSQMVGGSTYVRVNSNGPAASATGTNATAIGPGSSSSGLNSIAVGTGSQATQTGSIAVGFNSSSTGTNSIAIGTGATATGSIAVGAGASAANGGAAYGDGAVATGSLSTAVGPNASATAANSVAIGSGSTNTVANTVSFGSAGNERRLTNVAAGISQTDAVNVGQLQSVAAGFQSQLGGLQTQINDTRTEARGGVALALAASGLQYDQRPGKLSLAGAFGNFKGESGLAMGLGYAATERLRFNASVSGVPSQGSVGGTVSGSITLN